MEDDRRNFIRKSVSITTALSITGLGTCAGISNEESKNTTPKPVRWPVTEGPETPKLCVGAGINADEKQMQYIKQMGIDYVLMGGPRIPWKVVHLQPSRAVLSKFEIVGE